MMRLKSKLLSLNSDKAVPAKIFSPANCEELRIPFKADKVAKVVGKLAQIPPPLPYRSKDDIMENRDAQDSDEVNLITGVLVQNDFKMSLMAPEDLREYAGLTTTTITCRQHLTLSAAGVDLIRWALEGTFGALNEITVRDEAINGKAQPNGNGAHGHEEADEEISRSTIAFRVMDCVTIHCRRGGEVEIEWEGNMINDGIADAVLAVLFTVESSPAAVRRKCPFPNHSHPIPFHAIHLPPRVPLRLTKHKKLTFHPPESSRSHSHSPPPPSPSTPHPHATTSPSTRLSRLFMFLEAQFGPTITPIAHPRLTTATTASAPSAPSTPTATTAKPSTAANPEPVEEPQFSPAERAELRRLHGLGIPVPGVEIRFDNHVARVWLEDLAVECKSAALRDRVRAVVERAVETVSGLWV